MNARILPWLMGFLLASVTFATAAVGPAPRAPQAAVLHEPGMPVQGVASAPETMAVILKEGGFQVRLLGAEELADPKRFNVAQYDLVVIPTGATFPAQARESLLRFLKEGGNLVTTGGYAFNQLVRKTGGRWVHEEDRMRAALEEATQRERSLLPNGGFERPQDVALNGASTDGQWHRSSDRCRIVEESSQEGRYAAKATLPEGAGPGAHYWLDLPAKRGASYQVSGWIRAQEVTGRGMAFIAMYQYDKEGKLVEFRDFATARGTTPWRSYQFTFTPKPNVDRLHISFGFYEAHGTAWFDDIRLADVTGLEFRPMNTSTGTPADGLIVTSDQLGMFDASFPLKRARGLRPAPGQHLFREPLELRGELTGWAASGVVGYDDARWLPLLETLDRYGLPRGAAGAMLLHYRGPFAGSCWAYFGLENLDLFADPQGPAARGLARASRFMVQKTFLHNLALDHRLYRADEPITASVILDNRGRSQRRAAVEFVLHEAGGTAPFATAVREIEIEPGKSQRLEATFAKLPAGADLCRVTAVLRLDGEPVDEIMSGFVVERPEVAQSAPPLRFVDNYFTLGARPMFLFGSDSYSVLYKAACENPLAWSEELSAARDMGLNLYEVLQYTNPDLRMTEDDWRAFSALAQLVQKQRMVFMPGMLIGQNVAISPERLAAESELCREYAKRLGGLPSLLWYINGDYQLDTQRDPQAVKRLWNEWLKEQYGSTEKLRAVWGKSARAELGQVDFPPPDSGRWDDAAAVDRMHFQNWLTARWNQAHVAAVRQHDRSHPITSEYYQIPMNGMDLVQTIDGQDVSNIGYFDRPGADIDNLPLKLLWNDLRLRGKGVSLGEYGVKTHPAWNEANGGDHYHIVRSEEEQKRLFLAVAHYGLGLGACKVQNWSLRDDSIRVFPWGLFYPNQLVPKDIAYVHRNESIVWRHFQPVYRPAALAVCLANQLRLGNDEALGTAVGYHAFADLLAMHYQFSVIDDDHLDRLPAGVRAMIYPAPLAMNDESYGKLLAWVRSGGNLLVTGDFSHDSHRQHTRTDRLKELAGVESVAAHYPPAARTLGREVRAEFTPEGLAPRVIRPCIRIKPLGCEVLGKTTQGEPVLVRNRVGRGSVLFFTDPVEMAEGDEAAELRRQLYAAFLRAANSEGDAGLKPIPILPDEPWLQVMRQPTAQGLLQVVYNTGPSEGSTPVTIPTAAGKLELATRNGWPALAAVSSDGKVLAVNAFGAASVGADHLLSGKGLKAVLSLDGNDLRKSEAILVAPFELGSLELPQQREPATVLIGDFRAGRWNTLERLSLDRDGRALEIDADRATCLVLVCRPGTEDRWTGHLSRAMQEPDQLGAY